MRNFTTIRDSVFRCSLRPSEATRCGRGLKGGRKDFGLRQRSPVKLMPNGPFTQFRDRVRIGHPTTSPQSLVTTSPREGRRAGPTRRWIHETPPEAGEQRRTLGVAPFCSHDFWCVGGKAPKRVGPPCAVGVGRCPVDKGARHVLAALGSGQWTATRSTSKLGRQMFFLREAYKYLPILRQVMRQRNCQ